MSTSDEPRALWFAGPRVVELRTCASTQPGAHQVRARGLVSGVSQGTELLLYRGEGPVPFDPSLPSADTYPLRYGYAWVGEVVERGAASRHPVGARVFALASHAEEHVLDDDHARPLPVDIPAPRCVLAASLETAITCVWDAEIDLGDEVVVLGGGVVGALCAWLASKSGAAVRLVEPSVKRREAALALGIPRVASVDEARPDASADVVVEATGDPRVLDAAIAWARHDGRVVVASFYGARVAQADLGGAFHRRRVTIASSQVSRLPPRKLARWDAARRFDLARSLLADPSLDALLEAPIPFERAPRAYADLDAEPRGRLQTVFAYDMDRLA